MKAKSISLWGAVLVGLALGVASAQAAARLVPGNPLLSPLANSHTALTNTPISITYDEAIDPLTVDTGTFAVYSGATGSLPGMYSVTGGMITLTPGQPFFNGELIDASATTGTLGVSGFGPLEPTVWQFRVMTGPSSGVLEDSGQQLAHTNSLDVALGDLDGDGDLDAYNANAGEDYIWLNNGAGIFTDSGQRLGEISKTSVDADLADLDRDGDLDAFVVVRGASTYGLVFFNDGSGVMVDSGQNPGAGQGLGVSLGDLDGDGDLDAVYARTGPNLVLLNDGSGHFTNGQQMGSDPSTSAELGDLDGDGDLDIFVTNSTGSYPSYHQVWLNNGHATFTNTGQLISGMTSNGVALGDMDGDGALDAVLAISRPVGYTEGPNEVWLNNGAGVFSDSGQRLGIASTNQAVVGDMDGDGDLDAFFANLVLPNELWLNDGNGTLSKARQFLSTGSSPHVALGDVNRDGDLDVFLTHFGEPDGVWMNLDQISWSYLAVINKH